MFACRIDMMLDSLRFLGASKRNKLRNIICDTLMPTSETLAKPLRTTSQKSKLFKVIQLEPFKANMTVGGIYI